jgi:hypothetical protein
VNSSPARFGGAFSGAIAGSGFPSIAPAGCRGTKMEYSVVAGRPSQLLPVPINPEVAVTTLLPMTWLPDPSLAGPLLVMAGKPSPLAPSPSPMTRLPIDRRAWRGRGVFDHRLWRRARRIINGLRICRAPVFLAVGIGNACPKRRDDRQPEYGGGYLDYAAHD